MEIILDTLILLHPEDSKTNVSVPFVLQKEYRSLELACSYTPKDCDDTEQAELMVKEGFERYTPPEYRRAYEERYTSLEEFIPSVVNLLTLSLDWDGEYLGCAHRHAPEQRHIISADFSSPGFFRHAATAGNWRAMINVHAVVSPEVRYRLQVFARTEEAE